MVDIKRQVEYWRRGAQEDWDVALDLLQRGKGRYALFFAHLSLEKLLKAHVCQSTKDLAPRTHALLRLAELSKLTLTPDQRLFLSEFDRYQIEGRYPDSLAVQPALQEVEGQLDKAKEMFTWLIQQL